MSILTIDEAKEHLNISLDFTDDDNYLQSLVDVSGELIEKDIQRLLSSYTTTPSTLKHAAKILISTFYENREAVIVGVQAYEVPFSYKYLISNYKKYTVG